MNDKLFIPPTHTDLHYNAGAVCSQRIWRFIVRSIDGTRWIYHGDTNKLQMIESDIIKARHWHLPDECS